MTTKLISSHYQRFELLTWKWLNAGLDMANFLCEQLRPGELGWKGIWAAIIVFAAVGFWLGFAIGFLQ